MAMIMRGLRVGCAAAVLGGLVGCGADGVPQQPAKAQPSGVTVTGEVGIGVATKL